MDKFKTHTSRGERTTFLKYPQFFSFIKNVIENLRMLAVKTTCKDRWRQILNEADKIHQVHLFTLQEGVSLAQYREMRESGVRLVVPSSLHKKYPEAVRAELMTLGAFIAELTGLYADIP
ncbi:TPA: type II restriction endonuclease [Klebsiella pneumoniae]